MYEKKSKTRFLQEIVAKYRASGEPWPARAVDIAGWAVEKKLWEPQRSSRVNECAHELANAMREEHITDPQGRRIRKKHAIRQTEELPDGKHRQLTLWVDIVDATRPQMQTAFQQRRMQVLGDCSQLKTDVDSYNENYNSSTPIQLCFDFTEDLRELEQHPEYDDVVA